LFSQVAVGVQVALADATGLAGEAEGYGAQIQRPHRDSADDTRTTIADFDDPPPF